MWKKGVLLAVLGYALGIAIGVVIFLANGRRDFAQALPYILLCGIPGAVAMGTSVIYEVEKWSVVRATVTHFVITFACLYLVGFALGWFRFGDAPFWIFTGVMVAAYVVIWQVQYQACKRKVRKMNEDLRRWKAREKE